MKTLVYDAVRTPRGKAGKGALAGVRPVDLLATVLVALAERSALDTRRVNDFLVGCSTATGEQGADIARSSALYAGWGDTVAGATVSRLCCSGVDALATVAAKIDAGVDDVAVAGGVESMSRVGMFDDRGPLFSDPEVAAAAGFLHIGVAADALASSSGIARSELDRWALRSQTRAADGEDRGCFARAMITVRDRDGRVLLDRDEAIRRGLREEDLADLPPMFASEAEGRDAAVLRERMPEVSVVPAHTLASSPKMVDGASAALLGAPGSLEVQPRARVVSAANVAVRSPLLTGAAVAARTALDRAGMVPADVDLFEINESYAAVPLHFARALDVDEERMNVHGGALAMGHPLGATGGILLATLLDALEERDLAVGLLAIPAAAGLGSALVIERCDSP